MSKNQDGTPVIQKTNDYNIFDRIRGNRNLNKAHIQRLKTSLSKDATCIRYNPILVNEFYQIIDGQHRLEAIVDLNLPVYFIKEDGLRLSNAQALNMLSKPWSPMDYAKSYAELGNKNYKDYIEIKKEYGLNHDVLMRYLAMDYPITGEMFRSGSLEVENIMKTRGLCICLSQVGRYFPRYKTRSFALAFKTIWQNPKYNHDRLIMKLEQDPNVIVDRALPEDYIRDLEQLYNHGLETKNRVRFF